MPSALFMKQQTSNPEEPGNTRENTENAPRISARDIAYVGLMVAVIEVCKAALSGLPNVELTSFWIVMFTICFGWRIIVIVPVFILIEGMIYGVHVWWIMYLYVWPLLAFLAWIFRKREEPLFWAVLSGAFTVFAFLACIFLILIPVDISACYSVLNAPR